MKKIANMAFYKRAALAAGLVVIAIGLAAQAPALRSGGSVTRDAAYGADAEQKLDVFSPKGATAAPVVVFVHGGGFEVGDKRDYENITQWLSDNGFVGVNMNYRLHPAVSYPAQEQDVAAAVRWIKANIAKHGGDPNRIVLWGHSSGGSVVGNYIGTPALYGPGGPGVKGAILLSAPLNLATYGSGFGYFGTDRASYPSKSPLTALLGATVPVLLGVADNDLRSIPPQQDDAVKALCAAAKCPQFVVGHGDHMSEVFEIGGRGDKTFTDAALAFIRRVAA